MYHVGFCVCKADIVFAEFLLTDGITFVTPKANFNAKPRQHIYTCSFFVFIRGCTDIICCILFMAVILGYIVVGILGESNLITHCLMLRVVAFHFHFLAQKLETGGNS